MSGSLTADVELDEQKRFRSTFVLSYLEYGFETRTRTIECLKYGQVRLQFTRRQMEVIGKCHRIGKLTLRVRVRQSTSRGNFCTRSCLALWQPKSNLFSASLLVLARFYLFMLLTYPFRRFRYRLPEPLSASRTLPSSLP